MDDHEVWECERRFWLDTSNFHREHVAPNALIVRAAREHPRWTSVTFSEQRSSFPSVDTALLAYEARAEAACSTHSYHACCSSTYIRVRRSWMLMAHQQGAVAPVDGQLTESAALNLFFAPAPTDPASI